MKASGNRQQATVREILAEVERLYQTDKARYKPLYGCVNKAVKQRRSLDLILRAVKRMGEKDATAHKALDVAEYFFATLRKLEQERDSKTLRQGGASSLGEILNRAMAAAQSSTTKGAKKK